jgi:hypothetical protein
MSNQDVDGIDSDQFDTADFTVLQFGFDSSPLFGIGLGVNLGDAKSGEIVAYDGSGTFPPLEFKNVDSHDVMLGMRWKLKARRVSCPCSSAVSATTRRRVRPCVHFAFDRDRP